MGIGKRITKQLRELGWERKDLMDKTDGLTPQALSNLIRRDSKRSEWDEKIAAALGMHVMDLVYGQPPPETKARSAKITTLPINDPATLPATVKEIVALAGKMSSEGQYILLGRAQELAMKYPLPKANNAE